MSEQTRREIGELLADQLEAIQPELDVMAYPYRRAAEMTRRVDLALEYLRDCWLDCKCPAETCVRHDLEAILLGDQ